jgi:hypothetical protein
MARRQTKGDYRGGSIVASSDHSFTKLEPNTWLRRRFSRDWYTRTLLLLEDEEAARKAKRRKKPDAKSEKGPAT